MRPSIPVTLICLLLVTSLSFGQAERVIRDTYDFDATGEVSIDTYKGSVKVEVWDKDQISFEARIDLPDEDGRDAQERVDLVDIRVDASSGRFRVETSYDRLNRHRKHGSFWDEWNTELPYVHYTLKIPAHASLIIEDYKSSTQIAGLIGRLDLETYKGDAVVKEHSGEVRLETYKGDIVVEFRENAHAASFETYKGDIRVGIPHGAGFDADFDLGRRADLLTDFDIRADVRGWKRDDRRFRDSVNGGGPKISFETTKGTIRLDSL